MNFNVERAYLSNQYRTLVVEEDNAKISSGLLSKSEARALAENMFHAVMTLVDVADAEEIIREHFHEVFYRESDLESYVEEQTK